MPGTAAPYPRAMVPSPVRIPVVPQYHGVPRVSPLPGGGVTAERHRCHQMVTPDRFPAKPITLGRNRSPLVHQMTPPSPVSPP